MSTGSLKRRKIGPGGQYDEADLDLFAVWRSNRERATPRQCNGGEQCWVELGPRGIAPDCTCIGCGGRPRPIAVDPP